MQKNEKENWENIRTKYLACITLKDSESQIQWNRYNAILVVNTIFLGIFGFNSPQSPLVDQNLLSLLPIIGILICLLWLLVTYRGFMWSEHWITQANKLEQEIPGKNNPVQSGAANRNNILNTRYSAYSIIIVFLFIYYLLLKLPFPIQVQISIQQNSIELSELFYNYSVGIGAILAGLGGLKIFYDWSTSLNEKRKKDRLREELRNKYPAVQHEKIFRLILSTDNSDWVYLHDLLSNKKFHIASMSTLNRCGWRRNWAVVIPDIEFQSIEEGDEIFTDGERFS